jgi:ribose transport system permease protein
MGVAWELTIAAVVIGGASLNGGKGNAVNTLMGVILGLIGNILNLLNVPSYPQQVVKERSSSSVLFQNRKQKIVIMTHYKLNNSSLNQLTAGFLCLRTIEKC